MNRLRECRKRTDLTMKQVGKAIGVSEATMSLYENGKRLPDCQSLVMLAELYNVTTDYLLGKEETVKTVQQIKEAIIAEPGLLDGLTLEEIQNVKSFIAGIRASKKVKSPAEAGQ